MKLLLAIVGVLSVIYTPLFSAADGAAPGAPAVNRVQLGMAESRSASILIYGDEHTGENVQFIYCPISNLDDPNKTEDVSLTNEACTQIGPRAYSQAEITRLMSAVERRITITAYGTAPLLVLTTAMALGPQGLVVGPPAAAFFNFASSSDLKELEFILKLGFPGQKRRPLTFAGSDLELAKQALIVALKELEIDEQSVDLELGNPG